MQIAAVTRFLNCQALGREQRVKFNAVQIAFSTAKPASGRIKSGARFAGRCSKACQAKQGDGSRLIRRSRANKRGYA
jgi:hypothetical protein